MSDKIKLAIGIVGSVAFLAINAMVYSLWVAMHYIANFDPNWSMLLMLVGIEFFMITLVVCVALVLGSSHKKLH